MTNYNKGGITKPLRARTNPFSVNKESETKSGLSSIHSTLTTPRVVKELHNSHDKTKTPFSFKREVSLIDDDDSTPRSLIMPKKLKSNKTMDLQKAREKSDYYERKIESLKGGGESDGKISCPFCFTTFPFVPKEVQKALDSIEDKNKHYKEIVKAEESESGSVFCKPDALIQRPIPSEEKEDFCRLHRIEILIKPQAKTKGYPESIRFSLLRGRVRRLIPELEKVVRGETHSHYRDIALKAYDELGTNKARSSVAVMSRFEDFLPGYYGPRGSSIISDCLSDALITSDILTTKLAAPQRPYEYIQQVLIPETAYRLIKEDYDYLDIDDDEAKQIMKESNEYGQAMNPLVDDDNDTGTTILE